MLYPTFRHVWDNFSVYPAYNVASTVFPQAFKDEYSRRIDFRASYEKRICRAEEDPIVDGIIIGKAGSRYARDKSLIGLTLIELSKQRFIAPFYAHAPTKQAFVDARSATLTDIDRFSDRMAIDDIVDRIRENEGLRLPTRAELGFSFPVTLGAFELAEIFGLPSAVESLTGMPELHQAFLLYVPLGIAVVNHLNYVRRRNYRYHQLAETITSKTK